MKEVKDFYNENHKTLINCRGHKKGKISPVPRLEKFILL